MPNTSLNVGKSAAKRPSMSSGVRIFLAKYGAGADSPRERYQSGICAKRSRRRAKSARAAASF